MANASYYIIIERKKQVMLSFLNTRVIVNNKEIYPLLNTGPVVIPVEKEHLNIVITDGFHFTKPLKLAYDQPGYFNFEVTCVLDDLHLLGGLFLLAIFYLLGLLTGFFILKLLSFLPVIWFLFFYYFNRKDFLKLQKGGRHVSQTRKGFDQ